MADNEGTCRTREAKVVSISPDVCLTPMGSDMVPVPYPIISRFDSAEGTSNNVNFGGDPAFHMGSSVTSIVGHEAGTGGGISNGAYKGTCRPVSHSGTTRVNGQWVVRHGDDFDMNCTSHGNTSGRALYVKVEQHARVTDAGSIAIDRKLRRDPTGVHVIETYVRRDVAGKVIAIGQRRSEFDASGNLVRQTANEQSLGAGQPSEGAGPSVTWAEDPAGPSKEVPHSKGQPPAVTPKHEATWYEWTAQQYREYEDARDQGRLKALESWGSELLGLGQFVLDAGALGVGLYDAKAQFGVTPPIWVPSGKRALDTAYKTLAPLVQFSADTFSISFSIMSDYLRSQGVAIPSWAPSADRLVQQAETIYHGVLDPLKERIEGGHYGAAIGMAQAGVEKIAVEVAVTEGLGSVKWVKRGGSLLEEAEKLKVLRSAEQAAERMFQGATRVVEEGVDGARVTAKLNAAERGSISAASSVASRGGRNAGFLKRARAMSKQELERSARKLQRVIDKHKGYLLDPSVHVPDWLSYRTERQLNLLKHWQAEITTFSEQLSIVQDLLQ